MIPGTNSSFCFLMFKNQDESAHDSIKILLTLFRFASKQIILIIRNQISSSKEQIFWNGLNDQIRWMWNEIRIIDLEGSNLHWEIERGFSWNDRWRKTADHPYLHDKNFWKIEYSRNSAKKFLIDGTSFMLLMKKRFQNL